MTLVQTEPKKILMWSPSKVPSEYQEVEWIGTTGTQWIDTGIFAYNNYQTETKIKVTTTSQNISIFGTVNSTDTYNHKYYHLTPYANSWYFGTNNVEGHGGTYSPVIGTEYEIIYNNSNSYLNVNGSDVVSVSGTVGAPGSTLAIGRRGGGTLANPSYFNYYYFKVYDKTAGAYVMNFVPCYRIADGVIGMYDLIGRQFYTNVGTGVFTKGNDVTTPSNIEIKRITIRPQSSRLPSAYQEVEWIASSGTQYINTGLNIADGYRQVQKIMFFTTQTNNIISGGYLGQPGGGGTRFYRFYFCGIQSNGQWSWGYLGDASGEPGHQSGGSGSINTDYELDICWISGNAYYKVDGTALMTSTVTWSSNLAGECCLFGGYSQDSNPNYISYHGGVRVYYSKFYDSNGVLVRNFIPCYRKADSVIGMYDLVTNQFYTNSGTGTFTKGDDVQPQVEKQIRPAIKVQTFDFQNNGALDWTNNSIGYGDCSIVSGQGWQITRPENPSVMQGLVMPPSSIYGGTLKKRKIWAYKNANAAIGIANSSTGIEYGRDINKIIIDGTLVGTLSLNGEITMEAIIEDNGHITLKLNDTNVYDLGAYGSEYQNFWSSQNLGLELGKRRQGGLGTVYIRKVEITTI